MLAGTSEAKVTPLIGTPLLGCLQRSNGVHDDLFVRAMVLSDGSQRAALVCADLIGVDFALADEIRTTIQQRTGISNTLLNCSHMHSAPFTIPWSVLGRRWLCGAGRAWRRDLVAKVTDAVSRAAADLSTARLLVGRAPVQIGLCRRISVYCCCRRACENV
jgi:predicted neutral ceramidase superfamily lipid hydrolase